MSKRKQNGLSGDTGRLIIVSGSIIFLSILGLLVMQWCDGHDDAYMKGKEIVESIKFDDLQTSMLMDGTVIKVTPSAEYPGDKIVEYEIVRFPVENHNGKSVVVATYAKIRK